MKYFIISIFLFALTANTRAQTHWTKTQAPFELTQTPYFLNPSLGFEFSSAFSYHDKTPVPDHGQSLTSSGFFRTTDGGNSWTPIPFFDSKKLWLTQLCFVSPEHGFASAAENEPNLGGYGGVFETHDSGTTWSRISPNACAYSAIYASANAIFACEIPDSTEVGWGTLLYSLDGGSTWDSLTQSASNRFAGFLNVIGNKDSLVATTTIGANHAPTLILSTNGGKNWQQTVLPPTDKDALAVFAYPHQCRIIIQYVSDSDKNNDTYSLAQADPPYTSWIGPLMHDEETGRWVSGNACAMYIANAWDLGVFVNRSVDSWDNWKPILTESTSNPCEEIDDHDFRNISTVGYGAIVFLAAATDGELWKTTDGGDGTLSAASLAPQLALGLSSFGRSQDTLLLSSCSQSNIEAYNQNIGCSYAKFDSISIVGLYPSEYSVVSTHHCFCRSMPDTSFIAFDIKDSGTRNVTIHYHFTDDEFNRLDTSITFVLVSSPFGGHTEDLHREAASAYFGQFDSLAMRVDIGSDLNIDSLWPYLTDIQATYRWDSGVVKFKSYLPPSGWAVTSLSPSGNSVDFSIHKVSSVVSNPLDLGTAIFQPMSVVLATSWITLPILVLDAGGNVVSLCTSQNEDSHWSVKTLDSSSGVEIIPISLTGISLYPVPAHTELTVVVAGDYHASFTIFDPLGRKYSVPQDGNVLDVSSLPAGVYFVCDDMSRAKFIKE